MSFLVFNRRFFTFSKIFQILNCWPQKNQKMKVDLRKSSKNDQKVQNSKFFKKVIILQKL